MKFLLRTDRMQLAVVISLALISCAFVKITTSSTVIQLNLLVIIDGEASVSASVQTSAIEAMLERAVNRDWRLLGSLGGSGGIQARLVANVYRTTASKGWVATLQQACQWTGGYHGIIAIGDCKLVAVAAELANSMRLPLIAVPTGLCDYNRWLNNYTSIAMEPPAWYLQAAVVSMNSHLTVDSALILYDIGQASSILDDLQAYLAKQFPKLASTVFQVDAVVPSPGNSTVQLLSLISKMETGVNVVIVIASEPKVLDVIRLAASNGYLSVNIYWIVISPTISPNQLLSLMPASYQIGAPNLLLIRGPTNGQLAGGVCSVDLAAIFDGCKAGDVQAVQVRVLDALLEFGRAFHNVLGNGTSNPTNGSSVLSNGIQAVSNASCIGGGWNGGPEAARFIRNADSYSSAVSTIKFNSTTGDLQSDYLEFYALQSAPSTAARFLESGRYYPHNSSVIATFPSRNRRLIFPNTFVGFVNLTLNVCAVVTSPYSINVSSLGQIEKPYQSALLDVFAQNLQFNYVLIEPTGATADQHRFCLNEILYGRASFALLFDAPRNVTPLIDYSLELSPTWLGILSKRPARYNRMWAFYRPFDARVWITVLAFMLAASLIVYLLAYFNDFSGPNLKLPYAVSDEVWFQEYMFSVVSSFLLQGHDFYPLALSPRIVLAFWWMLTVIIYGAYTGELASQLTTINSPEPISSLDKLVDSADYGVLMPDRLSASASLPSSLLSRLTMVSDSGIGCAENILRNPDSALISCIAEKNIVNYYSTVYCRQVYSAKELLSGSDKFNGLAFVKNWPYADRFNYMVQRAKESGLLDQLDRLYFPAENADCKVAKVTVTADSVSMEDIGGVLVCGGVLYLLGSLLIGFETLWTKILKRKPF